MDDMGAGPAPNETVILLAEDEPVVRNLVRTMLTQAGYAVLTANDGEEALEVCKAFTDDIHLFLTDVEMPRVDGLTAAAVVRKLRPEIKVIVMSGYTTDAIGLRTGRMRSSESRSFPQLC